MQYNMKKRIIYTILVVAMLFGFSAIAIFGLDRWGTGSIKEIKLGLDLAGGVSITYQAVEENPSSQDMDDTVYKLQKRVESKSTEAEVYREGSDRITVEIPGVSDANKILEELGKPGALEFLDSEGYAAWQKNESYDKLLTGSDVKNATAYIDNSDNLGTKKYGVQLEFTDEGSEKFAKATEANVGKVIYIVYDKEVISYPTVNTKITGGTAVVEGMGSWEAAQDLASFIRIGSTPVELKEIRSQVVGAKLGQDAIQSSLFAAGIGLIILCIFMIIIYRIPGVVATFSLIIYTGLTLFLISIYEITLTLPGIAGIILGIGMAVDANVIIYSRIREELGAGRDTELSIKEGYSKAFSAIFDGNITTLIAAAVLAIKGSGSVKGFASTLALSIVVSMFTALVVSRVIMRLMYNFGIKDPKFYGKTVHKKTFDFLSKKGICFICSGLVILIGIGFMVFGSVNNRGAFNYSLDFVGGTSTTVTFKEEMTQDKVEKDVIPVIAEAIGSNDIQQQIVTGSTQVVFKTVELDLETREKMNEALIEKFGIEEEITAENISSTVSNEMKSDAVVAVILATICMLLYIWFRFKDIRFAGSAVIALLHDVAVVVAFYAVARISVGNTFIACMLTIVGYSINATIIIFDRIRENLKAAGNKTDLKEMVNQCITWTLSRTLNTTITTLIMLVALFIFGVASIQEFALPLIVGMICGAYSSVFITGALWYIFKSKIGRKKKTA